MIVSSGTKLSSAEDSCFTTLQKSPLLNGSFNHIYYFLISQTINKRV